MSCHAYFHKRIFRHIFDKEHLSHLHKRTQKILRQLHLLIFFFGLIPFHFKLRYAFLQ